MRVKLTIHQKYVQNYDNVICIGVDCKVDKDTLLYKEITEENDDKIIKNVKGPEHHLTFTRKMGTSRKYLIN